MVGGRGRRSGWCPQGLKPRVGGDVTARLKSRPPVLFAFAGKI